MEICGQFLFRQLQAIRPKAICALGSTAAKALLGGKDGVTKLRGKWHKWHDIPLIVTYHPSYLLRAYNRGSQARSVGRSEEGSALRLRLTAGKICYFEEEVRVRADQASGCARSLEYKFSKIILCPSTLG